MFYTSLIQVLNVDGDNGLVATGKKNRLAFFKVHKVSEGGVRMFESVVHPRHFVRLKKTHVDILVRPLNLVSIWLKKKNYIALPRFLPVSKMTSTCCCCRATETVPVTFKCTRFGSTGS